MKRIIFFLVILVLSFSMIGCSGQINTDEQRNTEEFRSIYESFQHEYDIIDILATDLYEALYYGIHEENNNVYDLANMVSLSQNQLNNDYCDLLNYNDVVYTVGCIIEAHVKLNSYSEAKYRIDILDMRTKKVTPTSDEEIVIIEKLEEYHSALVSLLELSQNNTEALQVIQSDIQYYRDVINDIELDLQLDLG